jgi:transcriptional regulator with XRE-family HTH domain
MTPFEFTRKKYGLTYAEIATQMDISITFLWKVCRGEKPAPAEFPSDFHHACTEAHRLKIEALEKYQPEEEQPDPLDDYCKDNKESPYLKEIEKNLKEKGDYLNRIKSKPTP